VTLAQGANAPLSDGEHRLRLVPRGNPNGLDVDLSAYLLREDGRVSGDGDMVFYNQRTDASGAVSLDRSDATFRVDLDRVPPGVQTIRFCLVVDGGDAATLETILTTLDGEALCRHPLARDATAATIVCEFYRRAGSWKVRAVGQGFVGGMEPLARSFGVDVQPTRQDAPPVGANLRERRLVDLAKRDPGLATTARAAGVSLAKRGLSALTAKVCLVADISASMRDRYLRGSVDALLGRVLGLALNIDDDGAIDTFAFGSNAHWLGEETAETYRTFTSRLMKRTGLEPNTYYGKVMRMVRDHYRQQPDFGRVPVYVMFLTDGGTNDPRLTETQIVEASREGIFWQFMAVGELPRGLRRGRSTLPKGFDFLAMLDTMPGRHVDNANFFAVEDPDEIGETELYDLMMAEYPEWLEKAKSKGVLAR
jgi:stress response protein SCP2